MIKAKNTKVSIFLSGHDGVMVPVQSSYYILLENWGKYMNKQLFQTWTTDSSRLQFLTKVNNANPIIVLVFWINTFIAPWTWRRASHRTMVFLNWGDKFQLQEGNMFEFWGQHTRRRKYSENSRNLYRDSSESLTEY